MLPAARLLCYRPSIPIVLFYKWLKVNTEENESMNSDYEDKKLMVFT